VILILSCAQKVLIAWRYENNYVNWNEGVSSGYSRLYIANKRLSGEFSTSFSLSSLNKIQEIRAPRVQSSFHGKKKKDNLFQDPLNARIGNRNTFITSHLLALPTARDSPRVLTSMPKSFISSSRSRVDHFRARKRTAAYASSLFPFCLAPTFSLSFPTHSSSRDTKLDPSNRGKRTGSDAQLRDERKHAGVIAKGAE